MPRREPGPPPRQAPGFTLLEVLVALLIFGLAFGVLAQIFQTGLRQSATAEQTAAAIMLARSHLARIGIDLPLEIGAIEEEAGDGFRLRTTIAPAGLEVAADDQLIALLVEVAVMWGPMTNERQVALTTLRLAPVASEDRPR
ncbi:MAG: type IV pilus modification PilV family protein [Geminicoccaceae bacterium]